MGRILGRRLVLLIVFAFAFLINESCAMEAQPTTTVKASGNGQGDGEPEMDQTNGQAQRNVTTEAPAQNQTDNGGSAYASGTAATSGREAQNAEGNGQAQRNATTEAPAQNQGDTGGSAYASGTTATSGKEAQNAEGNGQAQRKATTETPAQNQGDIGGSAYASGTTATSGIEAQNAEGNGQAQRNATTEAPAQNQGGTGGSEDTSVTTTKSGREAKKDQGNGQAQRNATTEAPAQNQGDTEGSADASVTTTKGDGFMRNDKNSNNDSTTTQRSWEGAAQTEAPRQSGTRNEGGVNSTPAQSNQGSSDQKYNEQPGSDSTGGTYNETGTNQQAATERNHQNMDSKDGQNGTDRPSTKEGRETEDNGNEDAAQSMTTPKNNEGSLKESRNEGTQSNPTDEARNTGEKGDDGVTTRRPEETQQDNQEHAMTTTMQTDNVREDGSGSVTDAPRQSGDKDQAKSTPKTNMNERQQTESSSDTERPVYVKATTQPNSNEKQTTGKPPPRGEDQVKTSPRTAIDQRSPTEKTQDQDDGEHVRTTTRSDVSREGEMKRTERPNIEGGAEHERGTPAGETESSYSRKTQGDDVKPTPQASEGNSTTVYRFPRLDLAESIFTLSDEDECTPFTLTFSIPPPREGDNPSGTDDGDETGTDGEVISYEDFSTLREEQFLLPDLPFALSRQDANQLQGKTKRLMTDEVAFKSDKQLVVEGKFCDMGSRLLELCLTLDGSTRIRTSDAPEGKCHNITLYSGAPVLTSARLSDTADAIVIFFDKDVNAKNLRECSAIFDNATLNLFGEEAQCDWRQGKELVVLLSKSSTIETGSQITLKEDSIKAFKQKFSHTATGSFKVNAPNNPVTPTARIDGDPKVPSCGSVKLSGRRSKGGGSRGLTYTWSLRNPGEGVDEKINKILKKANDGNNADLVIPGNLLLEETPYEWRLNVRNIQELEHSTTFILKKATGQEPRFEIRTTGIPEVKPVKVTSAVSLFGDISFNRGPGCPKLSASDVQFQWSISGAQFEEGAITMNKRVLKFPPKTLPGNRDITAALTVTYGAENPANLSKSVTFSTAYEPLVARIKGGESLTAGVGSDNFTLDCSQSQDPNYEGDGPDEGLSFEWRCWQKTDRTDCSYDDPEGGATITLPTFDQGSAKDILTVDPSKMTAGKVYSFSCYVDKDNFDQVHDSVTIMVTENNPPRISLRLLKSKDGAYRPDSDVAIQSTVSGDDISELKWDDVGGGLDGFDEEAFTNIKDTTKDEDETTLTTSDVSDSDKPYTITIRQKDGNYYSLLRIKKDRLRAGSRYEMQVSALSGEEVGTSTIEFRILPKVSGCQFEFGGNDSYVDTATGVSYSVQACAAEEDKTLTYQAFTMFTLDDQKSSLRLRGQTSEYPDILVSHDVYDKVKRKIEDNEDVPFQVGVRVCYQDTKICADFKKDVTYVHVPLTAEEVDAKKEEINDLKKEGRPVEGLKTANGAQKAVASQNTEGERKRRATVGFDQELLNLQMELLILATGDPSNYDGYPGDVQSMVDAAVEVPINAYQPEEMREILGADKDVLESVKDLDERLPQETLDGIRQHLEDAKMAFGDGKFFTENREILGLLSKCLSKNSVTGERVLSHGDGILITIEATLNIDPILIPKGDGDITFNGGEDVRNRYGASWEGCGCDECVGVLVEFFIYRGQDYVAGESHGSDVVSLQFINPCTGDPMEVQNLEEPASMSIPFSSPWSTNDEPVCSYYDEDMMAWSQAGVETLVDGMDVVCRTNHTTEYVIDFVMVGGAVAEPTATTAEGGEMITQDDDDDDDDDMDIPGLNGLLGLGIGVIVGIVLASLVVLAIIIVLIALVIKNLNKPKMIVEPIVKA